MSKREGVALEQADSRICFVSSVHTAYDKRVFDKEARSLAAAGYTVFHVCFGPEGRAVVDGVQIDARPRRCSWVTRIASLLDLYRRARRTNADVYHCNEVDSWLIGIALKLFRGGRVVFDVHEHYPENFAEVHFPKLLRRPVAGFVRLAIRCLSPFTDHFVLAKRSVAKDYAGAKYKRIFVLNTTSAQYAVQSRQSVPAEVLQQYLDRSCAVHLGLFNKARGWPQLVGAMRRMRRQDMHTLVIGTVNDGSQTELDRTLHQHNMSERVRSLPWMPFDQAYQHVLCCKIGLITFQPVRTNYRHALPHKLFDYMAAGLPVIVPDFADEVKSIVERTECGLVVDTTDPQAIADSLDELLEDPDKATAMGRNGRKAVLEQYNWESQFQLLLKLYDGWFLPPLEREHRVSSAA